MPLLHKNAVNAAVNLNIPNQKLKPTDLRERAHI